MSRRYTACGTAALVALVVATMIASVSPAAAWTERSRGCYRYCQWKCDGVGAFGRCVGRWYKSCSEWYCSRSTGSLSPELDLQSFWDPNSRMDSAPAER